MMGPELNESSTGLDQTSDAVGNAQLNKKTLKDSKKLERKEWKALKVLSKLIGVDIISKPTVWLGMWGPSLAMGVSKCRIDSLFPKKPVEIRMYENQMYTAIRFATVSDAEFCKRQLSGTLFEDTQTIYIGYLQDEPPEELYDAVHHFKNVPPEGLVVVDNFVSVEEEELIFQRLSPSDDDGQSLKRRWVRHFGFDFNYSNNNVNPEQPSENPIPDILLPLMSRMVDRGFAERIPEQITLNYYVPGQGIPPHVDTHSAFEGPIISLSLKASIVMDFRDGVNRFSQILPQRSLLVMNGASRYQWTHGIANRTFDLIPAKGCQGIDALERRPRLSLTFRLLRKNRTCDCKYPYMCDSQKGKISEENASNLESTLVHQVYDEIASHFSSTRHTPWPEIKKFVENMEPEQLLLDVGCGNGKYLGLRNSFLDIGTDISSGLLSICREVKQAEVLQSNCLTIPFQSNTFDSVICIAVIHHLATEERRLMALQEIHRVLVTGGNCLVYVWARNQVNEESSSVYAKIQSSKEFGKAPNCAIRDNAAPSHQYSFLPIHNRESNFPQNDMLVPWISGPDGTKVHHRFYHVFNEGELEALVEQLKPTPKILRSYYDQGNYCVHFEKR